MPSHVFVSYSRSDSAYMKELVAHLAAAGIPVWIDESLQPGTPVWVRTVERAIEECAAFVPIMSPASTESAWVDREIDLAQELNKPILPLLVEGRRFLRLRDMQTEDVRERRLPAPVFLAQLRALLGASPESGPTRPVAPPARAREVRAFAGHEGAVVSVVWSPDGSRLATAGNDKAVRIWNVATATTLHTLDGHTKEVAAVAWSPDGGRLASVSADGTARIWVADTGRAGAVLKPRDHTSRFTSVAWSPDGRRIATGLWFDRIRIWDVDRETEVALEGAHGLVSDVAWSPDGRSLAGGGWDDNTIRVWDVDGATVRCSLSGHQDGVMGLAWSPDGGRLASAGADTAVRIWDPRAVTTLLVLRGHTKPVRCVAWSPDGGALASTSTDHSLRLWDPDTGAPRLTVTVSSSSQGGFGRFMSGDRNAVWSAAWSPDGRHIATASHDGVVRLWEIA